MPRFSIIVPFQGDESTFENTLASVLRFQSSFCRIVGVHDGSYPNRHQLDDELQFVKVEPEASLIRHFQCGLRTCDSEWVGIIRPGVELADGWEEQITYRLESDPTVGSVSPILATTETPTRLVAAGVCAGFGMNRQLVGTQVRIAPRQLRKLKPLGPTSWAAFYRRSALEQLGTPDESLEPLYLDLDLALGLHELGFRNELASDCILTISDSERIYQEAALPHGFSAQRARRRFPKSAQTGSPGAIAGHELLRGLFQFKWLRHCAGRWRAGPFSTIDNNFAKRIKEKRLHNLAVVADDRVELTPIRRAA